VQYVLSRSDLSPTERLMLIALATHRHPRHDWAEVSVQTLAHDCGLTPNGARKVLRRLEELGFVERKRRMVDGVYQANLYRFFLWPWKSVGYPTTLGAVPTWEVAS
jgi:DNA-binding MarR family transcriptional regulator